MPWRSQSDVFAEGLSEADIANYNRRFGEQVEELGLWFDCRHCVHFVPDTGRCAHDYPNDYLMAAADERRALNPDGNLVFCKYFEIP